MTQYAINNVTSFSAVPMQIVTLLGMIVLQLFSSSVIMISLGIIGYYIAKIYVEVKDKPKYIISELGGEDESAEGHI